MTARADGLPVPEILWNSCDGMMVIDEHRKILAANPAMEALTGYSTQELVGQAECAALFCCRDRDGCQLLDHPMECPGLKAMRQLSPIPSVEYFIQTPDRRTKVVSASYTPMRLPGGPLTALVVMRDFTLQNRRQWRLARQARTDFLTDLATRAVFLEACRTENERALRHHHPFAVAMADLDGFKRYNDTYGHLAGDDLLKSLARLMQINRRASDLVARYGGDEFAILLPETDSAGAMVVAERLSFTVRKFPFAQAVIPVSISIGVATFPEDGSSIEALLDCADRRLYQAKQAGGNRVFGSV